MIDMAAFHSSHGSILGRFIESFSTDGANLLSAISVGSATTAAGSLLERIGH